MPVSEFQRSGSFGTPAAVVVHVLWCLHGPHLARRVRQSGAELPPRAGGRVHPCGLTVYQSREPARLACESRAYTNQTLASSFTAELPQKP